MKKLILLCVVGLFASCSKVETPKSEQVFAKVKISNSFIESMKGIHDTMRIEIDCVGSFAQSGTTEFTFIVPENEYTPCYDVDYGLSTYTNEGVKNVQYRIIGRNEIVKSGFIKFSNPEHFNVIN